MVLQRFLESTRALADAVLDKIPEELRTPVVVGVVAAVPLAVWLIVQRPEQSHTDQVKLPARLPTTKPIIGDTLEVLHHKDSRHDWFTSLGEHFGGRPFQLCMPGRPPINIIYTVETAEDCLKTHFDHIPKGPVQREGFRDVLGHGIFAVDGPMWVHQRKTASNMFTARLLRDTMAETMRTYVVVLLRIMQDAVDTGKTIDVYRLLNRFTMEAFSKMGFGIDLKCMEVEEEHPFQSAFDRSQRVLVGRFQRPTWFWKLQRWLNVGNEADLKKDVEVIDSTVIKIIEEALINHEHKQQQPQESEHPNLVSLFLDRFDSSSGQKLDPTYLRDIVVNFLIAGRDTTAQAMSWCIYNLHKHPEVVAKIRKELMNVIPGFASGQDMTVPTVEQVNQLTYLEATLKETLRLHPSVPALPKAVAEDTLLSDGTLLRRGTVILISVYTMGRMEFIWGPDAKEFKPERWIDETTGKLRVVSPFQFVSFNAGPRTCLGMNLAMLEMKIVMASVLSRFNVNITPGQHVTYANSLTLPVRGQMMATVSTATAARA